LHSIRSTETCYGRWKTESFHILKGLPKFIFPFGWYLHYHEAVIGIYAPIEGNEDENDSFYKLLQKILEKKLTNPT
jgi:hypothetical protein